MEKLTLVTTEKFNNVSCNFYRNSKGDILLTREQIGEALEYNNPAEAIKKIHRKHRDRLDKLCMKHKIDKGAYLTTPTFRGGAQETYLYTILGALEICRWSKQPNTDEFMDWCWDIIEDCRDRETDLSMDSQLPQLSQLLNLLSSITNVYSTMVSSMAAMQQQNATLLNMMLLFEKNNSKTKHYHSPTCPIWLNGVKPQIDKIRDHYYPGDKTYRRTYALLYKEFGNEYGDSYLSQLVEKFYLRSGCESVDTMDVVAHDSEARLFMKQVINNIIGGIEEIEKINLQEVHTIEAN